MNARPRTSRFANITAQPNLHSDPELTCNVCEQQCRAWILAVVGASALYIDAIATYLKYMSRTCLDVQALNSRCPIPRRRMHILYLINDLLHYARFNQQNWSLFTALRDGLKDPVEVIVRSCAGGVMKGHPTSQQKLSDLLSLWQAQEYYPAGLIRTLQDIIDDRPLAAPTQHGFTGVAWHDQPAGLMVPILDLNPNGPVNTAQIRPISFQLGQASEALKIAVDKLLGSENRDGKGGDLDRGVWDVDEMGQRLEGDRTSFATYYGWSEDFCKRVTSGRVWGQGGQYGGHGNGH
ncbi:hypothetical protein BU16DRAFT_525697 [Lophium mytilinum]|uniref:CID domain-containing protein n=1 Tax=Lophium mytilinum TaxID=390894 RepID=A0A6A6QVJ6_9PEZI|nr:hypothetical protein BU16DRAFT_525697 [Lophium mytilinum]